MAKFHNSICAKVICVATLILFGFIALISFDSTYAAVPDDEGDLDFIAPDDKDAGNPPPSNALFWETVETLSPGHEYDVNKYSINTKLLIDKPGNYWLKGKSTEMFVDIASGGVNLYLEDGLVIDPNAGANVGAAAPAINIQDQGGDVSIITYEGAQCALRGYLSGTIRKNGTNTKLMFKTSDASNPGYLRVVSGRGTGDAAVGSENGKSTGNISIESGLYRFEGTSGTALGAGADGNVDGISISGGATSAFGDTYERFSHPLGAAAVGSTGGVGTTATNINITGGSLKAYGAAPDDGYYCGAAIGAGTYGSVGTITIGGNANVMAKGGSTLYGGAAGIGNGSENSSVQQIIIKDNPVINAIGGNANAGIGGYANNITISGGTVTAQGGNVGRIYVCGAGIGGKEIVITGGIVNATGGTGGTTGGGVGIGGSGSDYCRGIYISGGVITATGKDHNTPGIGNKSGPSSKKGGVLSISGGTVKATGTTGANDMATNMNEFYISGGTILASSFGATPYNKASGDRVYKTAVTLEDYDTGKASGSSALELSLKGIDYDYGINDVYGRNTDGSIGKSYFLYLPESTVVSGLKANDSGSNPVTDTSYRGEINVTDDSASAGTLYPADELLLDASGKTGGVNGSALAVSQLAETQEFKAATCNGYTASAYTLDEENTTVLLGSDGKFKKNVSFGGRQYTDNTGKWLNPHSAATKLTLYALWEANKYSVEFDANVPKEASTKDNLSGTMTKQEMTYGILKALDSNDFLLPGYDFAGWNTKPDGSGDSYADKKGVSNLSTENGVTVKLYAQWNPKKYSVTFSGGDGTTGSMSVSEFTFDETRMLPENTFEKSGSFFTGWYKEGKKFLYKDEAKVVNLCGQPTSSEALSSVTLTAQWAKIGIVTIAITENGVPVTNAKDNLMLKAGSDPTSTKFAGFTHSGDGIYTIGETTNPIPSGEYLVELTGAFADYSTEGKTVTVGDNNTRVLHLDYATVEIKGENDKITKVWLGESTDNVTKLEHRLVGSTVKIGAATVEGYSFESYTSLYTDPEWQNRDKTVAQQTITINGQTYLEAHPVANRYAIVYDDNASDTTGTMSPQDMVYDEPQNLNKCNFTREGYTFAGWTTNESWSGTLYKDNARVENLSTGDMNGTTELKLYAQWNALPYYVHFNDNGSMGLMLNQKFFHEMPQELSQNGFERENWHFTGWNTEEDGSGTNYQDEEEVMNLLDPGDELFHLFAQWEHDAYTIRFNENGGKGTMASASVWTDVDYPAPISLFKKTGYEFDGWNTRADGSGDKYKVGQTIINLAAANESATLYAQWTKGPSPGTHGIDTGDHSNILLPAVIAVLALIGVIIIFILGRKKK